MNWRIALLAVAGLSGCQDAPVSAHAPAQVQPAANPLTQARPSGGTTGSSGVTQGKSVESARAATPSADSLEGLTAEFPWGNGDDGVWPGTDAPEPPDMKALGDSEIMQRALAAPDRFDREHALVSVGRRRLPGAFDAFRKALAHSEPLEVREMGLSGLIEHGGAEALPIMWSVLRDDPSDQLRSQAVWSIALYGADEARKAIDVGLADEDIGVRGASVLAVWALKDRPDEAISLLQSAAESDERRLFQEAFYNLSRMPWRRAGALLRDWARRTKGEKQRLALFSYRAWANKFPDLK